MTADELVEKVARELCAQNGDDPDETMIDPDTGGEISNWTVYSSDARAAVALVVEECAKVAENCAHDDLEYAERYPDEMLKMRQRAHRAKTIAAAIRPLSPSSGVKDRGRDNGYKRAAEAESRAKSAVARIAELEREVAMWKGLQEGSASIIDGLHKTAAQARHAENEACAQIAEKLKVQDDFGFWSKPTPAEIADAIRARIAGARDDERAA